MKAKLTPLNYCSRCGDEIPADEQKLLQNTTRCAVCCNMYLEGLEIHKAHTQRAKPSLTLVLRNTDTSGLPSV